MMGCALEYVIHRPLKAVSGQEEDPSDSNYGCRQEDAGSQHACEHCVELLVVPGTLPCVHCLRFARSHH
jgi:hypothetical protein